MKRSVPLRSQILSHSDTILQKAQLRVAMNAFQARASHLQSRLLMTLDTLDALQLSHREELKALAEAKQALGARFQMIKEELDSALDERDDMREAVLKLVEKGWHLCFRAQLYFPRCSVFLYLSASSFSLSYAPSVLCLGQLKLQTALSFYRTAKSI
jgi:hypothetical protein